MLVPGGVWARALASRFATAWRIRSSSPTRSEPPLGAEADRPVGVKHRVIGHHLGQHRLQVELLLGQRPSLVEVRQQQQVLDDHAHPLGLRLDPAHRKRQVVGPAGRAAVKQLGEAAHRCQRRAQLVRRVGHEPAQPILRLPPLLEGLLDLGQHHVQGSGQVTDLGAGRLLWHALCEVAAGDRRGRVLDPHQRPQLAAHQPERDRCHHRQHDQADQQLQHGEPVERRVDVVKRRRDHDPHAGAAERARQAGCHVHAVVVLGGRPQRRLGHLVLQIRGYVTVVEVQGCQHRAVGADHGRVAAAR